MNVTAGAEADLIRAMAELKAGEHLCLVYEDDPTEQMQALVPYIRQTLDGGAQFVYVADDQTVEQLRSFLLASEIDAAAAESRGALRLWTRAEWRQPGELESERKAAQVRRILREGLDRGFAGVNFAVEMTWTLGPDIDAEKLGHWEAFINTVFTPETPGRIICQYSRERLAPAVIRAGLSTHPTLIIGNELHRNPYYEAPLILSQDGHLTGGSADSARVDWMLSRLQITRALEKEREQRIRTEAALEEAERTRARVEALLQEAQAARTEVQEHADLLATLNHIGRIALGELDLGKAVQVVTDAATRVTRAQFGAFFYNVISDDGSESYVLYRLSGADRSHFERFPLPRNTSLFGPTFHGEGTIRIDDVHDDERFGRNAPYYGFPPGHLPVRSYLAVPVVARSGEVLGGLFFGHERRGVFTERDARAAEGIADQAAIAIENARLYEEAQRSVQLRDKFLGIASHELKTPLTVFKGYALLLARQLKRGSLDPAQLPGIVDQLVLHSGRLEDLVNDLLDTSRIQHGRLELQPESLDLVALTATVLERFEDEPRHVLTLDAPEPVVGKWDPGRIDQVLTNLIGNAVKYSPDGGEVHVSVREVDNEVHIAVRDQGIGISPLDQGEVFQPFRRLHTDARVIAGTGLGLYISSQIVARHGGSIEVESTPGKGSTFTVRLPAYTEVTAEAGESPK
jgi:signal transduction histidine kinase